METDRKKEMKNVIAEQKMEWNVLQPADRVVNTALVFAQLELYKVQPVKDVTQMPFLLFQ